MILVDLLKDRQILNNGYQAVQPKINVVLPIYNREKGGLLKPYLEVMYDQTSSDFELILSDYAQRMARQNRTDGSILND